MGVIRGLARVVDEVQFDGDLPRDYDRYLGPVLFGPYADDLADRLPVGEPGRSSNSPSGPAS
jgi:hypothetical protein